MARSKLQSSVSSSKESSLHRWVLLKNSIVRSHAPDPAPASASTSQAVSYESARDDDDVHYDEELDAFMFPDPAAVRGSRDCGASDSENQWLDSLLETLGDDDEAGGNSPPTDDDDEQLSPLCSPMSSSDNLVDHGAYFEMQPASYPYPPYPPLHPPLLPTWLERSSDSLLDSMYHDPLPYFDVDDMDDLPVPDAIEDTSDDESDSVSTPCFRSTSSLSPADSDSAPPPSPPRTHLHALQPRVYVDHDDSYFYPFDFAHATAHDAPVEDARPYTGIYQEC